MAETQHGVWGIDLGQCALKAIRLEETEGEITATAFDYVEHPKILSQPDADPDELTREALTKFLERNTLRGDVVAISVPGQSGLARFVKLPPVEEKKIADIVRFEAKQQIPFNLEEVVWDYQKVGSGTVTDGFAMETEIGLFAMKRDMIGRYLQHFKDVGVEVQIVQMAPLALSNYVAYDLLGKGARVEGEDVPKTNCVVALDIGSDSSNLVITDGDRVIWQRPIPLGGNHFTRALTKELKLTFAKAEHLKKNATKSPDLKKILSGLKPVLNDFVGEVQRSLGYFTNTHRNAQIDYMVGLGNAFKLPGLQKYLGEKLQLEVRKVTKMQRLTGEAVVTAPTYTENILSYGVAYGLALQGIHQTRIQTNLLPGEIRTERLVKAKKPWAAAAAALFLLGVAAMAANAYVANTRPWGKDPKTDGKDDTSVVTQALRTTEKVNGEIAAANTNYKQTVEQATKEADAVRSIVAGQDEQLNWIKFEKFISEAIPRADGSNWKELGPTVWRDYWEKKAPDTEYLSPWLSLSGEQAWTEYQRQLAAGNKVEGDKDDRSGQRGNFTDPLGRGIDDRVQFNIEMVNSRYCGDLAGYWTKVTNDIGHGNAKTLEEYVRPVAQAKNGPTGKGWVIEVHGYTFHHYKLEAVKQVLADNIVRLGGIPSAPPAPPTGGASAPAAPKKDDDPVVNHVSHVVIYRHETADTTDASNFSLIKNSVLAGLVSSSSAMMPGSPFGPGVAGPQPGMPPKGVGGPGGDTHESGGADAPPIDIAATLRDSWTPLGSIGSAAGPATPGSAGPLPGFPPGRKGSAVPPVIGGRGGLAPPGGPGTETRPADKPATPGAMETRHSRTEFIILFVWQEPTPSDWLRGFNDAPAPAPETK